MANVAAQTVIVTGGTSGVGLECAKALLAQGGFRVIVTGRDVERGTAIAESIGATFKALELGSLADVRRFVEELRNEEETMSTFHTLICNGGLQFTNSSARSTDGYEKTFAVNHLGHFLLVQLLLANGLKRPARIVMVASGTHDPAQNTPVEPPRYTTAEKLARGEYEGLAPESRAAGQCCYSTSKLCNILFAFELHRRLQASGSEVVVNAFDPGLTPGTSLAREAGVIIDFLFRHAPVSLVRRFAGENTHSAVDSGTSLAKLATAVEFKDISGKYLEHRNLTPFVRESSKDSLDKDKAHDLWETSLRLANIQPNEMSRL